MPDRFRRLHILCGAILAGLVLLNVVLIVLVQSGSVRPAPLPQAVLLILFAIALALLVASPAVKGAVFKRIGAEGFGADQDKIFSAYQTSNIIAFALREAGGLIGFILALLTASYWWSWGLGGAAVIAMIFDWPKREHLGL
jgi:F0F1-type ATP synthase membrane subunit c/vacuolar-type H+-ATPase subunit K